MKPILKTKRKFPFALLPAMVVFVLIGFIAFVYSVKYNKKVINDAVLLNTDISIHSPTSSSLGGYYSSDFYLSLDSPDNFKVYYTTDGSEPNLNSEEYKDKILIQAKIDDADVLALIPTSPRWKPPVDNVFKGTVVRAICVNESNFKSMEFVKTYFVKQKLYSFPVLAITINKDDFFGYKNGIYVMGKNYEDKRDYIRKKIPLSTSWWSYPSNYLKRGDNSERKAYLEYFEKNGRLAFESSVGVRINGNATRGFGQKSLRIVFDKKYGDSQLNYQLFPDNPLNKFNSFVLRNGGNDWSKTFFRDAFMQSLVKTYLDVQSYTPSIVFLNGEYWGIHNIRERSDEHFIANKYKLSLDSIAILEFGGDLFYGKKKDKQEFKELLDFIKGNNLAEAQNYQYIEKKIDVTSFIDFVIANVYFCNADWPNNNVKYWRSKTEAKGIDSLGVKDGRWRWMLFDTDWGFGYTGSESVNLNLLEKAKKSGSIGILFSGLLSNEKFVKQFKERFDFHLKNTFETNHVLSVIDDFEKQYAPEMKEHISRWRVMESYENWEKQVEELRKFAKVRPSIQLKQLDEFLKKK